MTILRRMVFREFIGVFMLGVLALTGLFIIVDFFDRVQRYVGEWGAPLNLLLWFMLYKIPLIVYQMAPLALPLSALVALGILNRNRELVAVRAGGISARSVLGPIFIFALLCSAALFVIGEYLVPYSNQQRELTYQEIQRHRKASKAAVAGNENIDAFETFGGWYRSAGKIYLVRLYLINEDVIRGLTILELGKDFDLEGRIEAPEAEWTGSKWIGKNVTVRKFPLDGSIVTETRETMDLPVSEGPNDFETMKVDPQDMGFFQLRDYIRKLEAGGSDMREFRVDLWSKVSYPLAGFLLVVLAVPFGLGKGRGASLSVGILISLVICISFYEFNAWMISIGHGGVVRPAVASWSADIIYGLAGIFAYYRSD